MRKHEINKLRKLKQKRRESSKSQVEKNINEDTKITLEDGDSEINEHKFNINRRAF